MEKDKFLLQHAFVFPMLQPAWYIGQYFRPTKSVLMVGPPGSGKSMLADAVATTCQTTFFSMSAVDFAHNYRRESERLVCLLFKMARFYAPSIIFIDDIDFLCSQQTVSEASRIAKLALLGEMTRIEMHDLTTACDDPSKRVQLLAATSLPWDIDKSLGKHLERRIYLRLPNATGREEILKINLRGLEVSPDLDLGEIANSLEGYSGKDIARVCSEASMIGMRRKTADLTHQIGNLTKEELKRPLIPEDFRKAVRNIKKSISQEDVQKYDEWWSRFGNRTYWNFPPDE